MLSDTQIRSTKPGERSVRLYDERGLYLEITTTGGRWWRFKYRFAGKEKLLSMGHLSGHSLESCEGQARPGTSAVGRGRGPERGTSILNRRKFAALSARVYAMHCAAVAQHSLRLSRDK
jgi:hypothetical protein